MCRLQCCDIMVFMNEDDLQFRAGQLRGRMQTLREVMTRLNATRLIGADRLSIFASITARHHGLHEWVRQTLQECATEAALLKLEGESRSSGAAS